MERYGIFSISTSVKSAIVNHTIQMQIYSRKQETQQNQMRISAYFPDVSSNYYYEYQTDFQDRELKSENNTFNDGFNGEYENHIKT